MSPTSSNAESPDRELFVRLLMKHDRAIRAYLRALLPTVNDVDEVMQEVSVIAWRKFDQLDDPRNFCRWACVIARYEVLMHRRRKARDRFVLGQEVEQLIADEGVEELSIREEQLDALENCLDRLPPERRQLTLKIYSADASMKTIAASLGKSPEAIYKMISRIRQKLLECVEQRIAGMDL